MKLADIVAGPWAITPIMLSEIKGIYKRHMHGPKIDLAAVEARLGGPLPGPTKGYDIVDGVAVIPVDGVLAKRMNLMTQISGGTSMQILGQDFQEAIDDPAVRSIILNVDSPGGTVDGTQELSNQIFAARGKKPIIALADGTMASAAYWIASAADQIFVSSDTAQVGSIGVVANHVDVSGAEAQSGEKTTEIAAGRYKRIASQYAPLSPEGRQSIQDQVDYTYSVFVNDVARNRGTTPEAVVEDMADGRIFLGQQAVDAGLADGVSTLSELIARANAGEFDENAPAANSSNRAGALRAADDQPTQVAQSAGDAPEAETNPQPGEMTMDVNELKEKFPAVAQALIDDGRKTGADDERARIQAVEDQTMPGHEALIGTLKFDGKTTGPEAAVKVLAAERKKKSTVLDNLRADASDSRVKHAAAPSPGEEDDDEDEDKDAKKKADDDQGSASPTGGKPGKKAMAMDQVRGVVTKARALIDSEAKEGRRISTAEAVARVERGEA